MTTKSDMKCRFFTKCIEQKNVKVNNWEVQFLTRERRERHIEKSEHFTKPSKQKCFKFLLEAIIPKNFITWNKIYTINTTQHGEKTQHIKIQSENNNNVESATASKHNQHVGKMKKPC